MFDSATSAFQSRSLQYKTSDSLRNHDEQSGGYGVTIIGRQEPTRCMLRSSGTARQTMARTERKVSWNEGSKRFAEFHTSSAKAAPAIVFSEFDWRAITGAKAAIVN